jgi:hypothetical protein
MEGMDEMGIFTTNIAINNPAANLVQGPSDKKGAPPAAASAPSAAASAPSAAGGMAGMAGMKTTSSNGAIGKEKIRSKRYGVIEMPEAIYPVLV